MVLPAFASIADLRARGVNIAVGDPDPSDDETRAQAVLDDVSTLIRQVAGKSWVTDDELDEDVPDVIFTVCCAASRRAYKNPDNVRSEIYPDYTDTLAGDVVGGVALTEDERSLVRGAASTSGTLAGIGTLSTTRGPLETADVCYDDGFDPGCLFQ